MKKVLLLFLGFLFISVSAFAQKQNLNKDTATLIFVRHAEKADDGTRNPPLTKEGEERAKRIVEFIESEYGELHAVYSTPYKRTEFTAAPSAEKFELEVQKYDPRTPNVFVKSLLKEHKGELVLIVGHSNTTPYLVNLVVGENKYQQLPEDAYNEIFVVKATEVGKGKVELKSSAEKSRK